MALLYHIVFRKVKLLSAAFFCVCVCVCVVASAFSCYEQIILQHVYETPFYTLIHRGAH